MVATVGKLDIMSQATRSRLPLSAAKRAGRLSATIPRLKVAIPRLKVSLPAIEMTRHLSDSLRPILEMGERLRKQMEPITKMMESLRPRLEWWRKEDAKCERLERAGWLPHSTSPEIHDETLSDDEVRIIVSSHYRENWNAVKASFLSAIQGYEIDDEAKETFFEALAAHEIELYRCPARLLFPEIERVSRAEIHAGAMERITNQDRLRDAIGGLTPAETASSGVYGMRLYFKLSKHLYAHVKDAESLAKVLADPTPNRHATIHGYAPYNTMQSSINALIMADFLFEAISTIKRLAREDAMTVCAA